MMKQQSWLAFGFLLSGVNGTVWADTTLPSVVVSSSQVPENIQSVSYLNDHGESMQSYSMQTFQGLVSRIEDLTDYASGVSVERLGAGTASDVSIRGFSTGGRLLVDGLLDNQTYFVRDLSTVEQIDIVTAKNGVLYGAGSPTGTVNFITKKPQFSDQHRAYIALGSYDQQRWVLDNTGSVNNSKQLAYRSILSVAAGNTGKENLTQAAQNWLGSLLYQSEKNSLLTSLEVSHQERPYDFDNVFAHGKPVYDTSYVHPNALADRQALRASIHWSHQLSASNQFDVQLAGVSAHNKERQIGFWYLAADDAPLPGYYREVNDRFEQWTGKAQLQHQFNAQHSIVTGIDWHNTSQGFRDYYRGGTFKLSIYNPTFNVLLPSSSQLRPLFGDVDYQEKAVFVSHRWQLSPSYQLVSGLRQSEFNLDVIQNTRLSQSAHHPLTYSAALIGQITPKLQWHISHNTSYLPNTGRSVNGGLFEPLFGAQTELGLLWSNRQQQQASINFYDIAQNNILIDDSMNPGFKTPIGGMTAQGVELNTHFPIAANWQLRTSLNHYFDTRIVSHDSNHGNAFPSIPKDSASLMLSHRSGSWDSLIAMMVQDAKMGDAANSFQVEGFTRWDLKLRWQENVQRKWTLAVRNLTDVDYVTYSTGVDYLRFGQPKTLTLAVAQDF